MYERPQLIEVGAAKDVILGIVSIGDDLDGFTYPIDLEFARDEEDAR